MMARVLVYALGVGVLLAGAAWLLEAALRRLRLPARGVWAVALAALVVLTGSAAYEAVPGGDVPAGALDELRPALTASASAGEGPQWLERSLGRLLHGAADGVDPLLSSPVSAALWLAWLAASVFAGMVLVLVQVRLLRARRGWERRRILDVPVRVSRNAGPLVSGLLRPEIVVPQWVEALDVARQRTVLLHEQEHVRGRDPWLLAGAAAALVLLPWHPVVWWLAARLRLAVELDCDERVLARGVDRLAYGTTLMEVAGRPGTSWLAAPALAHAPSQLERRILAMTSIPTRRARVAGAILVLPAAALALAACAADLPTAAAIEALDVEETEARVAVLLPGAQGDPVAYLVDGRPVTAEEARSLPAERIGSIEVQKGVRNAAGRKESRIAIATTEGKEQTEVELRPLRVEELKRQTEVPVEGPVRLRLAGKQPLPDAEFEGLLLIDGEVAASGAFRELDPTRIESIEVIKGEAAKQRYSDPRAARGVIQITTKR